MRTTIAVGILVALLATVPATNAQDDVAKPAPEETATVLKIKLVGVLVDDQEKAERFYTEVLGFVKKHDIPVGEFKWLTVVSTDDPDGTELLLEPNENPSAQTFQKAMFEQGLPAAMLFVGDVQKTYERLQKLGVSFTMKPTDVGSTIIAIFDDTCGNLIQIAQE